MDATDTLVEVLRSEGERYDPDNIFHVNQNIQPARDPGR
jgi:hypothetical protein